ncbi:hypothetical protein C8A05DRAFT_17516 [Staphylotrichum tortipilum]|uniref:F-box domain-containing protein n=1 Tax=Staphylotrichum tortipilum TaxID=2831512 RepID=A0AAN6MG62_9PEZI|nr:hypothetical protein C8A05DRAFT_17516 [Staphylotrichum longicolle]
MAATLTRLPPELLHSIFSHLDPEDLARLPLTCRHMNSFVKGNNPLCRAIYLRILDEPLTKALDFEQELHDLIKLKRLCSPSPSTPDAAIQAHLPFVYRTVTRLLGNAVTVPAPADKTTLSPQRKSRAQTFPPSLNASFLTSVFSPSSARRNFLSRSFIHDLGRALHLDGLDGETHGLTMWRMGDPDPYGRPLINSRRSRVRSGWRRPREMEEVYQMSAKLRCLYGWDVAGLGQGEGDPEARRRAVWAARQGRGVYMPACAKVYDLREYTRGTRWGPFLDSGDGEEGELKVDWEKVEAAMVVLGTNVRCKGLERFPVFLNFWGKPFAGSWRASYIPWSRERELRKASSTSPTPTADNEQANPSPTATTSTTTTTTTPSPPFNPPIPDPYSITGSWLRIVSFLDYNDFFTFNFPLDDALPRDVPRAPLGASQATRLILMRLRTVRVEPPGSADHPDHPVAHFKGFSRALDGAWDESADSEVKGTVRVTKEGEVRWSSVSVFGGEERWGSEGVQVGGVRAARGVVGSWFDKDFNPEGPCGPTAFWKISDREPKGSEREKAQVLLEDLFPLLSDDMSEELASEGESEDEELLLQDLDPFNSDVWAEYELEDELDAMYYFDADDVLEMDEVEAELQALDGLAAAAAAAAEGIEFDVEIDVDGEEEEEEEDEEEYEEDEEDEDEEHGVGGCVGYAGPTNDPDYVEGGEELEYHEGVDGAPSGWW